MTDSVLLVKMLHTSRSIALQDRMSLARAIDRTRELIDLAAPELADATKRVAEAAHALRRRLADRGVVAPSQVVRAAYNIHRIETDAAQLIDELKEGR